MKRTLIGRCLLAASAVTVLSLNAFGSVMVPGQFVSNSVSGNALPSSLVCNATDCDLLEGTAVNLPFIGFGGDVILLDPNGSISDVVRFFPNVLDTGGGTGLSTLVQVFSRKDIGIDLSSGPDLGLPDPATFSVNAVRINESLLVNGAEETIYNGNGTNYHIFSDVTPEPSSVVLFGTGLLVLGSRLRKRKA